MPNPSPPPNPAPNPDQVLGSLEKAFPGSDAGVLMRAAMLHRAKQSKQCEELLEAAAAEHPDAPRPLLSLAQLQLQAKDVHKAVATLRRVGGTLQNSLGMLGTLVALHERLGDVDAAAKAVANAVDGQGAKKADDKTLRAAAGFFSRHGRWEQAAAAQQALLDRNGRDLQALATIPLATDPNLNPGPNPSH